MPQFTVELAYSLNAYRTVTVTAANEAEACSEALEACEDEHFEEDGETAGLTFVANLVHGAHDTCHGGAMHAPIPTEHVDPVEQLRAERNQLLGALEGLLAAVEHNRCPGLGQWTDAAHAALVNARGGAGEPRVKLFAFASSPEAQAMRGQLAAHGISSNLMFSELEVIAPAEMSFPDLEALVAKLRAEGAQ